MKIKNPRSMNLIKIEEGAAVPPPPPPPPTSTFSGGCAPKSDQILGSSLKVVPRPSEAFLVSFWTDEKPYKCIGSK